MRHLLLSFALACCLVHGASAQSSQGFSPCTTTPASISASVASSNVALTANCGSSAILYNIGAQEAFWTIGSTSAAVATASKNSLPGNTYIIVAVPNTATWIAAITAVGTTTIRVLQGYVQ